ncbi:hypothetical protein Dimus_036829, partial [Dionaea muscipula]
MEDGMVDPRLSFTILGGVATTHPSTIATMYMEIKATRARQRVESIEKAAEEARRLMTPRWPLGRDGIFLKGRDPSQNRTSRRRDDKISDWRKIRL